MVSMIFYVVRIDIEVFVPLWNQALFLFVGEICVKCLYPGDDSLVSIGACCISLASQVLLVMSKVMEITGSDIGTLGSLVHKLACVSP
jgi:hypothetical protein